MRTDTPQTIYRKDYTAPSYLVDTVELGFDLDPARTVVWGHAGVRSLRGERRTNSSRAPLARKECRSRCSLYH